MKRGLLSLLLKNERRKHSLIVLSIVYLSQCSGYIHDATFPVIVLVDFICTLIEIVML